jgi:hypothetical protein
MTWYVPSSGKVRIYEDFDRQPNLLPITPEEVAALGLGHAAYNGTKPFGATHHKTRFGVPYP